MKDSQRSFAAKDGSMTEQMILHASSMAHNDRASPNSGGCVVGYSDKRLLLEGHYFLLYEGHEEKRKKAMIS